MAENLKLHFVVEGDDFTSAGTASGEVKKLLRQLGAAPDVIRKVAISMYEGEINMVIHANGGVIDVEISPERVVMVLTDHGPGIPDIEAAMREGFSTAPDTVRSLGFGAGMGLPNMKKYADSLEVDSAVGVGTTIRMTVDMQ